MAEYRGDSDNGAAVVELQHSREESLNGMEVREKIDAEIAVDILRAKGEERLSIHNASVVDEYTGRTKLHG